MKSVLAVLLFSYFSANALTPETFKGKVQELSFKALSNDRPSQLCESLGLDSAATESQSEFMYYPVEATLMPTNSGKYLALGSCYKSGKELKVLTRFFKDSTRDFSYPAEIFKNEPYPKQGVQELSFVKSPGGEFLISLAYNRPTTFKDELIERVLIKLDEEGNVDRGFAAGGKLILDSTPVIRPVTVEKPGFLKDGTVLDQSCTRGKPNICTVYNFSLQDGFLLQQKSIEYHPGIRTPFHFADLSEGVLVEHTLPLCKGLDCLANPAFGVSQGIWTFHDFLHREPAIDPRPTHALSMAWFYFTDGILAPFWTPETGQPTNTIDFLKFQTAYKRFDLMPEVTGPVRRVLIAQQYSPEIPFIEPVSGIVTALNAELDLNVGQSEPVLPSDPNNFVECSPNAKFGDGLLAACVEYDMFRNSLNYVLVAYDRNMRLNSNFADHGYFRPPGVPHTCLDNRFSNVEIRDGRIIIKCNESTFNGDFSINFVGRTFFFE